MTVLRYGADASVNLQIEGGPQEPCGVPRGAPLPDTAAAVKAALDEPLEYPPLARCTTPGDRVAIALGAEVPQIAKVTAAIVQTLAAAGIDADGITILRNRGDADANAEDPCGLVPAHLAERIRVRTHDPANRRNLAYLAASEAGEPIFLNRMLTDADVVLPVGLRSPIARPATTASIRPSILSFPTWRRRPASASTTVSATTTITASCGTK